MGRNTASMAEAWAQKYIYGIDSYSRVGGNDYRRWNEFFQANTANYSNVKLINGDYTKLLRSGQLQFDEIIALAPNPAPMLEVQVLSSAAYGINPNGRILIGSATDFFSYPNFRAQALNPALEILSNRGLSVANNPILYVSKNLEFMSGVWGAPITTDFNIFSWMYLTIR